jgi:hypothetical protein
MLQYAATVFATTQSAHAARKAGPVCPPDCNGVNPGGGGGQTPPGLGIACAHPNVA